MTDPGLTRRTVLQAVVAAALAPGLGGAANAPPALLTKKVPSTGEALPVIGLGTNQFDVSVPADLAARREVLEAFVAGGGRVVDTARAYGESEAVIGQLVASLGNREQFFLATKTPMGGDVADPDAVLEESFRRLRTDRVDLVQVHNFHETKRLLPALRAWKKAGRIRYVGVTTSSAGQYAQMVATLQAEALDFIQVNYSLGDRGAEAEILPLARDRGVAVLANMPLGGRRANLMPKLAGRALPGYARDIGATSWAQVLLKYAISHPAVTCAIPGATRVVHLQDNLAAGHGVLPDAGLRRRMEEDWAKA